ncbi:MAG: TonB-dependent receptor [Pelomonas sp.]|nr:TonB-dependent receptor [Roseateles sp.]
MNKKSALPALAPTAVAALLACLPLLSRADTAVPAATEQLETVTVTASADASAKGLAKNYAGNQVARGGRAGILGTQDNLDTPFSITAYTNELIQDRQARSVADVLQNDPGVRVARGYGNFQETYFIRGFILSSDDVAYNGLYSLLPRQYIATELFERVEVLRGASAFLMGASPNGGGIGGNINLLPKRAPNEPLSRVTVGIGSGGAREASVDVARRFGPDNATGLRVNAAARAGGTAVKEEKNKLGLLAVGADWHSRDVRLSADLGWQDNELQRTRTSITLAPGLTALPALPQADANFAQPWSYSNERDLFGTFRAEWDLNRAVTAWAAAGLRHNDEDNSLANLTLTNAQTGAGTTSRFDNVRKEDVRTGELGVRGTAELGGVKNEWVASLALFDDHNHAAYVWDYFNTQATSLYAPTYTALPAFTAGAFAGNDMADPQLTSHTQLTSLVFGDTLTLLDDRLLLTLGLRWQKLRFDSYAYDSGALTPYAKNRPSPVLGAVYKIDKHFSVYANDIEGLSQGDTVAANSGQPEHTLAPHVSRQQEVGLKVDAGRIGFSAAAFTTSKPRPLAFGAVQQQGEDRHRGIELNTYGELARGLKLLGGLTLLETRQEHTGDATTEGRRTLGIPRTQATLGSEWEAHGLEGLAVDGRVVYTGGVYADSANTLPVPAWTRLDLGARYAFEVGNTLMTLRARLDNATNKRYWASAGGYPNQGYLVIGAPRTFSLSLSADF